MTENAEEQWLPTRQTLLSRLKNWDDQQSWQDFFNTYWRLIYNVGLHAGLTETEAQEVVQETIITVARQMPGFRYNGGRGSFKGWLLHTTRWRIQDQFRKRSPEFRAGVPEDENDSRTAEIEQVADPSDAVDVLWDEAWERNLANAAIERARLQVSPKEYHIFDLHVLREWPVKRVADKLRVTQAHVYYAKYKVGRLIQREAKKLEARMS